jgi:SNF2 family DNA or RNA helicase
MKDQVKAFEKLSKLKAGALFMNMGTGKTKVAIDLIKSRVIDCVIWIAPASLLRTNSYLNEIKKWDNGKTPYHFFSIEGIASSDDKFLEMIAIAQNTVNFCVVDESITIKNTIAKRTARLLNYYHLFNYRLILNGTPLTKGLVDLYSQIQFISPKILNLTESQFAYKFLQYKKTGYRPWQRWSLPANEQALIEILRPYVFESKLDLESKINFIDETFTLDFYQRQNYEIFKRDVINKGKLDFLAIAQKFQRHYTLLPNKINKLKEIISKSNNDKFIIYVKFLDEVELIKEYFDCAIYTSQDHNGIEQFKNSKQILVATYGTGSFGHNLQFCKNIIYFSQTFDYKDKEQSLHRIYRVGQKHDVNIWNFWVTTGLEDLIKHSLSKKQNVLINIKKLLNKRLGSL